MFRTLEELTRCVKLEVSVELHEVELVKDIESGPDPKGVAGVRILVSAACEPNQ